MKIKIPIVLIELEDQNFHPVISADVNGRKGNWIIDTGASKTVFDKNRTDDYILLDEIDELHSVEAAEQPLNTDLAALKSIQFEDVFISKLKVAIIDLRHINKIYKNSGGPEICGLIGSDFLYKYNAVINYNKKLLTLTIKP